MIKRYKSWYRRREAKRMEELDIARAVFQEVWLHEMEIADHEMHAVGGPPPPRQRIPPRYEPESARHYRKLTKLLLGGRRPPEYRI